MKSRKDGVLMPLICGGGMVLSYIVMRFIYKGKYDFLHIISETVAFPPMWIFSFFYMISYFMLGVSLGFLIQKLSCGCMSVLDKIFFYKGLVAYSILFFLELSWYSTLLVLQMPILSFMVMLITILSAALLLYFWSKVSIGYALFTLPCLLWSAYLLILNLTVLFTI